MTENLNKLPFTEVKKVQILILQSYKALWWIFVMFFKLTQHFWCCASLTSTYYLKKNEIFPVFEPAQLPQKTTCPSVAFTKGQIGNNRGQPIIYYNIKLSFSYSINCLSAAQGKIRHFKNSFNHFVWKLPGFKFGSRASLSSSWNSFSIFSSASSIILSVSCWKQRKIFLLDIVLKKYRWLHKAKKIT